MLEGFLVKMFYNVCINPEAEDRPPQRSCSIFQIPLPTLSYSSPSFEINAVIASPLFPQHWEMTWQSPWDGDKPMAALDP